MGPLRPARLVRALAIVGMCMSLSGCVIVVRGNVSSSGVTGNDSSYLADISADGRYLVFTSFAPLVPNDNTLLDVFVRDRVTGSTERVSIGDDEQEGDGGTPGQAYPHAISADGRYVLFSSYSSNLVDNVDDNGVADLFVRDRVAGTTKLVSVAVDGTSGNAGTYVGGSLSNDGRYVAFSSNATDLVAGSHAGNDLYVRDLQTETTTYIALPGPVDDVWNVTLSGNGNVVAFNSPQHHVPDDTDAGGVDTFVYDRTTGQTERVSVDSNEQESVVTGGGAEFNDVAINDDGSVVAFVTPYSGLVAGDTNGTNDVFVRDRNAGTTERVSVTSSGGQATGHSGIGFTSGSNVDLDSSGRRVLFLSDANDLVPGDTGNTDVFLHDRQTATTTRVSTDLLERQLNAPASDAAIDGTGRIVGFTSGATNAKAPDPNSFVEDIFLRSAVVPTVGSVSPSSGSRGTQFVLTIHGSGFLPGTTAAISGLGLTVGPAVVTGEDTIEATVTIAPDAPIGARRIFVSLGVVASGGLGFAVARLPRLFRGDGVSDQERKRRRMRCAAAVGEMVPARTSASSARISEATAGSPASASMSPSFTSDHIQSRAWSARRALNAPLAVNVAWCSSTTSHTRSIPAPSNDDTCSTRTSQPSVRGRRRCSAFA